MARPQYRDPGTAWSHRSVTVGYILYGSAFFIASVVDSSLLSMGICIAMLLCWRSGID